MKKKMKTCAFTGHRPQNLPFGFNEEDERCIDLKKTLREQIINLIENEGVTHFISGMAIGVDMYAAEIVLGLKASYPGITLESAIPCESQAAKWSEALRDRYFDIASKCGSKLYGSRRPTAPQTCQTAGVLAVSYPLLRVASAPHRAC